LAMSCTFSGTVSVTSLVSYSPVAVHPSLDDEFGHDRRHP
jgi:hypothetical protein